MSFLDKFLFPEKYGNKNNTFNEKIWNEEDGFTFKSDEYLKGDWREITNSMADFLVKILFLTLVRFMQ